MASQYLNSLKDETNRKKNTAVSDANKPFSMVCTMLGVVFMQSVCQSLPEGEWNHKVSKRIDLNRKERTGWGFFVSHAQVVSGTGLSGLEEEDNQLTE